MTPINQTQDYNKFEAITGNRVINKTKIDKLINDINKGLNLLPYCPIIVYRDKGMFRIVDGQHRFETSKELGFPVYYVECEELNLRQIALINSRSDKWSNSDFLNCYVQLGVEDYQILKDFISKYQIVYSAAVDLLMFGKVHGVKNSMELFRDGEFKVNFLEEAKKITELTIDVFGRYKFSTDRYLIMAMLEIQKQGLCNFETLKQKVSAAPNIMDKNAGWKDYVYNIERVYNHNNNKRSIIFK